MGGEDTQVQDALYRIAELASAAQDMQEFYSAVHGVVGELMNAESCFIALYDEERNRISWPYFVDEHDPEVPDPHQWFEFGEGDARGTTAYVLRTGKPQHLPGSRIEELIEEGEIELIGRRAEDWLGVPLTAEEGKTVGVLVVASHERGFRYTDQDEDLLAFVGQHVGAALSRARAIEETRQRNAELALINSVQEAIAGELDQQAIYDIVGDKIREIFDAQIVAISTLDESAGLLHFPYAFEAGERLDHPSIKPRGWLTQVLETHEPVLITENFAEEAARVGAKVEVGEEPKSGFYVPLVSGGKATGTISLQNLDREHAFDDADVRLLTTLAGSLSVALENARLVHETRQRNAELALINSVQEALAGELELQAIYDVVGDKIDEIFDAQGTSITILDETTGFAHFPYTMERGERLSAEPMPLAGGFTRHVLETREPLMINEDVAAAMDQYGSPVVVGERPKSVLFVPLVTANGCISLENFDREHAFSHSDQQLLETLASSLSTALENARLVHETRQRNAELALINSVQEALAGELELQAIYDSVGDRIRDVFDAQVVDISLYDEITGLIHFPYTIERGERLPDEPIEVAGFRKHVMETREPLLINENAAEASEQYGNPVLPGEMAKSAIFVPLVVGGRATGVISLQNVDREHAFGESDQQLLETLAGSLSVALENARLVHETRQRNAELALINSVQEALAGELEMQAIYDVVGDKIQEIFDAQVVDIGIFDFAAGLTRYPYTIERGVRFPEEVMPLDVSHPTTRQLLDTKSAVLIPDVAARDREMGRTTPVAEGTERPQSMLFAPLVSGDEVRGRISLQNLDRTNAFTENDVRLLTTLAGSLSVALENARLVHETRQRNAELALITTVQDALAGELDLQAIYDSVGDRIRDVFDAQVVAIDTLDEATGLVSSPYTIERGERLQWEPQAPRGFTKHVLETRESILIVENLAEAVERYDSAVPVGEVAKSVLFVPLVTGNRGTGAISLQNLDREHAFSESDRQLLETLAGSLSVALENARLVHETRQRNAELALINSVQEALAGELEMQAIYDVVGDKIQEIFDAQGTSITILDEATGLIHFPYLLERGERLFAEPTPLAGGFTGHVLQTREPLMINEDLAAEAERYGSFIVAGEAPKSVLHVPLGTVNGVICLENFDREHAFGDADVRLLTTLAGSLSVALENAGLVHETRQRNAELALINGVQDAIAGELDQQAIYDAVGDRIREVFDAQAVEIDVFDETSGLVYAPYNIENGVRFYPEPFEPVGFAGHVLATRETLLINEGVAEAAERYGAYVATGEPPKSVLFVPLVTGGRATGTITLQNIDREHAFSASDQQLLETLAGSLSVALENARLVHETRQRNAELALINGVQDALAGELDLQAIYDAVGDRIRDVFDSQVVSIRTLDEATGLLHVPYAIERGERLPAEPRPPTGFSKHVLETRKPLLIAENMVAEAEQYGSTVVAGEDTKSALFVPLVISGRATGVIALENIDREYAFSESDQQLLETLAGSLSVALENARLVHETRQRNAELALINSVQDAIAGELDEQAIYDAVGDEIQDIFDAQAVSIFTIDAASGLMHTPYMIERGERIEMQVEPRPPLGFAKHVLETREPLRIDENVDKAAERYGSIVAAGEAPKSILFVPLVTGGQATGVISLQNVDREHAFGESDEQLLETLAGSLSVALENARLVHETRQRNAELALISGVQEAIAGELDEQAIFDAVGDEIQDIFDAQTVLILMLEEATGLIDVPYSIERGERQQWEPMTATGFPAHVLDTRQSLLINEDVIGEAERRGFELRVVGDTPKAMLFVPLVTGGKATGMISLQNVDREHAFSESDQQLLETLAGSLSVALENARLVHETRQRNAELALINGVQDAIAGELDAQAIYEAVGERIRDVFDAHTMTIVTLDEKTGLLDYPYIIERGKRLHAGPQPVVGFSKHVLETREPLLLTENLDVESERYGSTVVAGETPKSVLFVPLVTGGKATGVISLQNVDRERAFNESDQQLLETLAGSLSVALENARLVHETRQRNAELALINGVQDAIAGELDQQAIYDAVGDRIREIFEAQSVSIMTLDDATGLLHYPYMVERDARLRPEPSAPPGFAKHALETREPLLINENVRAEAERYGVTGVIAGEPAKSLLFVPLVMGGKATGLISLQNIDREHAFSESDQQLLETLAGSLSVALDNARLVHETRQRNAELGLITSVQEAIAGELDARAIYDAVGDRIRDAFDAQVVSIATVDEASGLVHYPYLIERDERLQAEPRPLAGFAKHVLETREPLLLVENLEAESERYGSRIVAGDMPKSVLFVPLVAGGKATAVISLQNIDREHAFDAADQQLLTTVAGSVSVALENARLVNETRQRVGELATVNSVGQALSSQLELDGLIELVGERVRETFDADIAYVALHNEAAGMIEFVYYWESGERRPETPLKYGEGLTSQILSSREPLLLNRRDQLAKQQTVGTPSLSYLGVPIFVGSKAIGAISVQSIEEEGRFGEADARLLATIAANVGIAIQNARLFTEVERQRQYLESLVSISPAAVVVIDAAERVTDWNPAAADLFGYSVDEALGRPIDDLVFGTGALDAEGREIIDEALTTGRAQRITRRRRRDGTLVDVELMLVPLRADGSHAGFLVMYHDVTELQRARQEAEAATQAKSAFLATMSHEIRTPMNAVIGMTDLLLGTELTAEQREFAEVVHVSGDALLHVIDDILDYSKIEAGKLDLERAPFNLRDVVEGALDIVAPRAWEKELELGCLIDDAAPAGIVGDEARLRQVLLNLLSNAVKFTERGEVMVLVNAEKTGKRSHRIELAVRDTGIGIPADRMDQLFTSFSQVDASTTRKFGGTGLGLAISKRLVELMGGAVSVESEQGKGSTFRISLPATAAEVPAKIPLDDGLPHLAGKRILIVDDNATNREIVTRHARSWGMEPVALELPRAALELIAKGEPFDVAVLDMMMPEMDGLALAGEIRQHRTESELPLLLLTSLGRLAQLPKGVFSAQLAKPLKASQLYNTLLQLLTAGRVDEEEAAAEAATDGKRSRSALRILLAEDNAMNQKVALRLLDRLGYRADVANNGLEAIAALEGKPYDVVLMDVQMPELDGLDATRQICERWSEETRPHIIAMTANALPEDREACFAAGMSDYVAKPIRAEELVAALKRARPLSTNGDGSSDTVEHIDLDDDALKNLRELGGDDFLAEVIDAFLADAPGLLATLRQSLDDGSSEEVRRAAHTLKSNGATLGAKEFADLCRTLEQRAKTGELEGAEKLVEEIEAEYRPLEAALAALRAGSPS